MASFATRRKHPSQSRSKQAFHRRNSRRGLFLERLEDRSLMAVVSHWTGDNTALDAVGSNHGTLIGGATYAAGQVGQAFSFDGVDDRIGVADSPSLALTASLSIEAWVKADSYPTAVAGHGLVLFRGDDRGGLDPYQLTLGSSGVMKFGVNDSTNGGASVSAPMPLGEFVHIAGTLDDATGTMRLYMNGVLVSQTVTTVRPFGALDPASNPGVGIGSHGGYPTTPHKFLFDGLIDELKLYDNALTAEDVLANFNATKGSLQPRVSISDVSVQEGDDRIKYQDNFVEPVSGGLNMPYGMIYGPDGHLYVSTIGSSAVLRYDAASGAPLPALGKSGAEFVSPGEGGLSAARGLDSDSDGDLYVASTNTDEILRFDGVTGAPLGPLVTAGSGGLDAPRGILFHDGFLYVTSVGSTTPAAGQDAILRFDITGAPAGISGNPGDAVFVPSGTGGMDGPTEIVFESGSFYVSCINSNSVLRFGTDGSFQGTFVPAGSGGLSGPVDLVFRDGYLYVTTASSVLRYNGTTGAFVDVVASGGGLVVPRGLLFNSSGEMLVASRDANEIRRYSDAQTVAFAVSLSAPFPTAVTVNYATDNGSAIAGSDYSSESGSVTFEPGTWKQTVSVTILDDAVVESSKTFAVNLSSPIGGTIADGQGIGTILDDETSKQISISDATATEAAAGHYRGALVIGPEGTNFNDLTFGPDGMLYMNPGTGGSVINKYDGVSGALIGQFTSTTPHLDGPREILFRGTYMYVASEYSDEVARFDAATGAFVDVFVAAGSNGIDGPHGMTFGPDTNGDGVPELFVTGRNSQAVHRFDGATGQPLGTMNTSGAGALSWPEGITTGPGNVLYVASSGNHYLIQKYDAITGAHLGSIANAALNVPKGVRFGADGLLYVTSTGFGRILRFTAGGTFIDDFVPAGSAGMGNPYRLEFGPDGDLYVASHGSNKLLRFGAEREAVFTVSLAGAVGTPVSVNFTTANGSAIAGSDYAATSGIVTFAPGETSKLVFIPILDDAVVEANETFVVNLSSPSAGATIVDGQGSGTIVLPTKFFVVDDATANKTFEYDADGSAIENYAVNSGNTAPRGAASTAAGDTVWVVDANRNVYVYNAAGDLLGSWTAGSLNAGSVVEGITVSGNDVWIVDAKSDKVFKYAGAASRTSGSQNAASSFSLNKSNANPKDLVTDGTSIWVVENGTSTDKVFKYTVGGSLLGSWTLDGGGGSPTGITLDPANVSHLWIVDNTTDRVYQFDGAASRTSGSQAPSTSFALNTASGNTNPQGIADPPVAKIDGGWPQGADAPRNATEGVPYSAAANDRALLDVVEELGLFVFGSPKKRR